jgi:hypothetical protein
MLQLTHESVFGTASFETSSVQNASYITRAQFGPAVQQNRKSLRNNGHASARACLQLTHARCHEACQAPHPGIFHRSSVKGSCLVPTAVVPNSISKLEVSQARKPNVSADQQGTWTCADVLLRVLLAGATAIWACISSRCVINFEAGAHSSLVRSLRQRGRALTPGWPWLN